jgi:hypothetical protein
MKPRMTARALLMSAALCLEACSFSDVAPGPLAPEQLRTLLEAEGIRPWQVEQYAVRDAEHGWVGAIEVYQTPQDLIGDICVSERVILHVKHGVVRHGVVSRQRSAQMAPKNCNSVTLDDFHERDGALER